VKPLHCPSPAEPERLNHFIAALHHFNASLQSFFGALKRFTEPLNRFRVPLNERIRGTATALPRSGEGFRCALS
jgi:hypothetical protein